MMDRATFRQKVKENLISQLLPLDDGPGHLTEEEAEEPISSHEHAIDYEFPNKDNYVNESNWISATANWIWTLDYC